MESSSKNLGAVFREHSGQQLEALQGILKNKQIKQVAWCWV